MNAQELFSLDSDFENLHDNDTTVELLGFICSIESPTMVHNRYICKFGLSNGRARKVMCYILGEQLINTHLPLIRIHKILHLDGAYCKASKFPKMLEQQGFMPFEIIIQPNTRMSSLGMHQLIIEAPPTIPPTEVSFETIVNTQGKISINGFIKTEFAAVANQYQNTYGCGSITDGVFKITINISNFIESVNLRKGTAINVIGEINNSSNPLTITCKDSSLITERQGIQPLDTFLLMRGNRPCTTN